MNGINPKHVEGKPCPRGHGRLRFRTSGECITCNRMRAQAARRGLKLDAYIAQLGEIAAGGAP